MRVAYDTGSGPVVFMSARSGAVIAENSGDNRSRNDSQRSWTKSWGSVKGIFTLGQTEQLGTTTYTWDSNGTLPLLVNEQLPTGSQPRSYTYGSSLLTLHQAGSNSYYHVDALGSVTGLSDSTGAAIASYAYDPFGSPSSTVAPGMASNNPMRFTGQYLDDLTGFYHLRAREYDATVGRFFRSDPASPRTDDPYVSAYVYANNRPGFFVDPAGLRVERDSGPGFWDVIGEMFSHPVASFNTGREHCFDATRYAAGLGSLELSIFTLGKLGGGGSVIADQVAHLKEADSLAGAALNATLGPKDIALTGASLYGPGVGSIYLMGTSFGCH